MLLLWLEKMTFSTAHGDQNQQPLLTGYVREQQVYYKILNQFYAIGLLEKN